MTFFHYHDSFNRLAMNSEFEVSGGPNYTSALLQCLTMNGTLPTAVFF